MGTTYSSFIFYASVALSVAFVFAVSVLFHCAMFFSDAVAIILYSTVLAADLPPTSRAHRFGIIWNKFFFFADIIKMPR